MFWGCTCCEGTHWHLISYNITDPDDPIENWRRAFYNTPDLDSGEDLGEHTDPSKPIWDAAIDNSGNVIAFAETPLDKVADYGRLLIRRWDASGNLIWSEGMELGNDNTFTLGLANSFLEIAGSFAFSLKARSGTDFRFVKRDLDDGSIVTDFTMGDGPPTGFRFGADTLWLTVPSPSHRLFQVNPATLAVVSTIPSTPFTPKWGIIFVDNSVLTLGGTSTGPTSQGLALRFALAGTYLGSANNGGSITTELVKWIDCDFTNRIPYVASPGMVRKYNAIPHPATPWGGTILSRSGMGVIAGVATAGTASGNLFTLRSTAVPQVLYLDGTDLTDIDSLTYRPVDQVTPDAGHPGTATVIKRSPNSEHLLICGSTAFDPPD